MLAPGGWFVTQQVDLHAYRDFYAGLGLPPPGGPASWLQLAHEQVTAAGLAVTRAEAGAEVRRFADIGAVAYYLRVLRHTGHGPDPAAHLPALERLHERLRAGPFTARQPHFLLVARKP